MGGDGCNRIEISWNHCPLGYSDLWLCGWVSGWLSGLCFCHYSPSQFLCLSYSAVTFIICSYLLIPPLPSTPLLHLPVYIFSSSFSSGCLYVLNSYCSHSSCLTVSLDLLCLCLPLQYLLFWGWIFLRHYRPTILVNYCLQTTRTQLNASIAWVSHTHPYWICTWCNNLIPGMALWKQNLLTCALAAAVTFEILSLWSYTLRETMVPLPETVLKIVISNVFTLCWMSERSANLCPFRAFFNFGKSQNRRGLSQVNKVDGPFLWWSS